MEFHSYFARGMNYDDISCLIGWRHTFAKMQHFLSPMAINVCDGAIKHLSQGQDILVDLKSAELMLGNVGGIFDDFISELKDIQGVIG